MKQFATIIRHMLMCFTAVMLWKNAQVRAECAGGKNSATFCRVFNDERRAPTAAENTHQRRSYFISFFISKLAVCSSRRPVSTERSQPDSSHQSIGQPCHPFRLPPFVRSSRRE